LSGNKLKDFIKKHHRDLLIALAWILIALAWILALVGMFVMTPIEGGIVYGALLIVISLLIAGYNMKIWDNLPLTSSWIGAISSILFIIILFSGFLEWSSNTFSSGYRQSGWHFTGALILASVIPLSFLVTVFIALLKKLPFIKLETSNIKLFFWISILLLAVWVMPILISEIIKSVSM
tara:strand:- start:121 stop:657 length:537 start_codon:yes stop_codon:yes gene_type:complete